MKDLISIIVKELVNDKDSVEVTQREINEDGIVAYEIKVSKDDVGRVIGKQGNTIKSIRSLVRAAAYKNGEKVMVEVV